VNAHRKQVRVSGPALLRHVCSEGHHHPLLTTTTHGARPDASKARITSYKHPRTCYSSSFLHPTQGPILCTIAPRLRIT
jgi:hypothetical protein